MSLLVIDVDHFKSINDHYGHAVGDEALRQIARELDEATRAGDRVYRYGGEEFVVLCEGLPHAAAMLAAERLRIGRRQPGDCRRWQPDHGQHRRRHGAGRRRRHPRPVRDRRPAPIPRQGRWARPRARHRSATRISRRNGPPPAGARALLDQIEAVPFLDRCGDPASRPTKGDAGHRSSRDRRWAPAGRKPEGTGAFAP